MLLASTECDQVTQAIELHTYALPPVAIDVLYDHLQTGTERAPDATMDKPIRKLPGAPERGRDRIQLNARTLAALKPGGWLSAPAARGEGVLQARRLASGSATFYLRTTTDAGRRERVPLGTGIDLAEAKRRAADLSLRYQRGEHSLRKALADDRHERERQRVTVEAAENAAKARKFRTLGALLTAYADQLDQKEKVSAKSVRAELHNHVRDAWPKLWAQPLDELTLDDLLTIVAKPVEAGNLRQAEKVRAYLRAAFAAGIKARQAPGSLQALRDLRISSNPARDLTPIEGANKARTRWLSVDELRAYWKRIRTAPEYAVLKFHLLTGCQRIAQVARATRTALDTDCQTLLLKDIKGKRAVPRDHYVPLLADALEAIREMHGGEAGPYLFTVTGGVSGASYFVVRDRVREVVAAMQENGELQGEPFTLGDLRRTVESQLSAAHISEEVRGHLQSHGLNGVQHRHYDMHEYLAEKKAALKTLLRLMNGADAKVIPIRKHRSG